MSKRLWIVRLALLLFLVAAVLLLIVTIGLLKKPRDENAKTQTPGFYPIYEYEDGKLKVVG